ncbi:GDSL-type esterase/lipase family protein [Glutamicibacter sp.]|uniref:GDSL-type esterase/lipase family protein n=1 Tax=Glutamicibacter sp. TaxID=1931995 RepID=UPI002B465FD9|nr:GDSL-type esterase/lipase family protein [Glutamicibacter sp.]HJX78551.1 GDSL-type esterase/lipase family protein [Glutamicibacter sp.]
MPLKWVELAVLKGPKGDAGTWYQRTVGTSDTMDTLTNGSYSVSSGAIALGLGLPAVLGSLEILTWGVNAGTATYLTRSVTPELWTNSKLSSGWAGWRRLADLWFTEDTLTVSDNLSQLPSGIRTIWSGSVALALGLPTSSMYTITTERWGNGTSGIQTAKSRGTTTVQVLRRQLLSGGWTAWKNISPWFDTTALTSSEHLDTLTSGIRTCWSGTTATAIGSPVAVMFDVETVLWGTGAGRQRLITRDFDDPREYIRHLFSAGWGPFKRVDAGASSGGIGGGGLVPASPTSMKRSAMSLTVGYGGAITTGQGYARTLAHIPAGSVRARVVIKNWSPRSNGPDSPAVALSKISIGARTGTTGQSAAWTELAASGTTGENGFTSNWVNLSPAMIGNDCLISYGWQSSGDVQMCLGYGYTGPIAADATTGTAVAVNRIPMYAYIELETLPTVPTLASFTDSIGVGVSATYELYDSWLDQYCRPRGIVPMHWGSSGESGMSWESPDSKKWTLYGTEINQVDGVIYGMGSNQLSQAVTPTLQEMIDTATKCVENLRKHVSPNVYGATIIPRTNVTGDFETRRREFNAWMKASPLFTDVFDMSAAVSNDDETLRPEFDADGIHLNTAGYAAMAATITRLVVTRGITVVETAGRVFKVWDYLNQREQLVYGDTGLRQVTLSVAGTGLLRREGRDVTLYLRDVVTPTGSETIYTLPAGFTPDYSPQHGFIGRTGSRALAAFSVSGASVTQNGTQTTAMYVQIKFTTNDPWPTSLPGSAVGVIPHQ